MGRVARRRLLDASPASAASTSASHCAIPSNRRPPLVGRRGRDADTGKGHVTERWPTCRRQMRDAAQLTGRPSYQRPGPPLGLFSSKNKEIIKTNSSSLKSSQAGSLQH
jgi:hypothetical protein